MMSLVEVSSDLNVSPALSFTEEEGEDDVAENAVEASHVGFLCKINRFTVLTAMIMWMVGKTRHANQQLNKAIAFLNNIKEKKAKDITQRDRECIQISECEYTYQYLRKTLDLLWIIFVMFNETQIRKYKFEYNLMFSV